MKLIAAVLGSLFILVSSNICFADDYYWNNTAGGLFGDSNNWNPYGIPGEADIAFFDLPTPYTITFDDAYFNDQVIVNGGEVTMDLDGWQYYIDYSSNTGDRAVVIGAAEESTVGEYQAHLTAINGTIYSKGLSIGKSFGADGYLTVGGEGTSWTVWYEDEWYGLWIGEEGRGNLCVSDNARLNNGHGWSAVGGDSEATIVVNGAASEWYVDGQFEMSVEGVTNAHISEGGRIRIGKLDMAIETGSFANIVVNGEDHDTELAMENWWDNTLAIGKRGQAEIVVNHAKFFNAGTMTIAENFGGEGLLEIHEGTWADCAGSVAIGGTLDAPGGLGQVKIVDDDRDNEYNVEFTPTLVEGQSVTVWPHGTITMDGGVIITEYDSWQANPIILKGGTLEGHGMIWAHVENNGGVVAPSDTQDSKRLEIGYNYTQNATGTLKIEIGGVEMARDYSLLQVNNSSNGYGEVSLDGMLEVELTNGFVPYYNYEFFIISAGNITGTFSNATEKYVFEGGSFDVIYNTDSVILTHYSAEPTCPRYSHADLNKDCMVNLTDFAILAGEWLECNFMPESYCLGGGGEAVE